MKKKLNFHLLSIMKMKIYLKKSMKMSKLTYSEYKERKLLNKPELMPTKENIKTHKILWNKWNKNSSNLNQKSEKKLLCLKLMLLNLKNSPLMNKSINNKEISNLWPIIKHIWKKNLEEINSLLTCTKMKANSKWSIKSNLKRFEKLLNFIFLLKYLYNLL